MQRIALFFGGLSGPSVIAQDQVAVGAFVDYYASAAGLASTLGHRIMLEAEISYDLDRVFTENFGNGRSITNLRVAFGPYIRF